MGGEPEQAILSVVPVSLQELRDLITEQFDGSDPQLQESGGRIFGLIVWKGFKGASPDERNREVTAKVRERLGYRGLNVGFLIPVAPDEQAIDKDRRGKRD